MNVSEKYSADHNDVLHTSRQCHCRDVSKISLWSVKYIQNWSVLNFHRISNSIEICLVGRAPGLYDVRMHGPAVDIIKIYLSSLKLKCNRLFPNPVKSVTPDRWFSAEPMGKNTLSNMMQRISQHAGLSQKYTCHCVRAPTITTLFQAGFPTQQTVLITKNKDTKSLGLTSVTSPRHRNEDHQHRSQNYRYCYHQYHNYC